MPAEECPAARQINYPVRATEIEMTQFYLINRTKWSKVTYGSPRYQNEGCWGGVSFKIASFGVHKKTKAAAS